MAKPITPFLDLCSWLLVNEYTHVSGKQSPINEDAAMMNKAWIFCLPVLFCVYSCLTLGVGAAQAQCSAWQFNVLLPKIGCSPQSIQQILFRPAPRADQRVLPRCSRHHTHSSGRCNSV